jgi:hypothetical protein
MKADTIYVIVKVKLSLWAAFKLRLAGVSGADIKVIRKKEI